MTSLTFRVGAILAGFTFALTAGFAYIFSWVYGNTLLLRTAEQYEQETRLVAALIESTLEIAAWDVKDLAAAPIPAEYGPEISEPIADSTPPSPPTALQNYLLAFAKRHRKYRQIRILDRAGWERVRINCSGGECTPVAPEDLQFKGDRGYFIEAQAREPGELYVSAVELNQEQGVIEVPHVPVVRVGTRIPGVEGRRGPIIFVNIDLREVLRQGLMGHDDSDTVALLDPSAGALWQSGNAGDASSLNSALDFMRTFKDGEQRDSYGKVRGESSVDSLAVFRVRSSAGSIPVGFFRSAQQHLFVRTPSPLQYWPFAAVAIGLGLAALGAMLAHKLTKPYRRIAELLTEKGVRVRPGDLPEPRDRECRTLVQGLSSVLTELHETNHNLETTIQEQVRLAALHEEFQELSGVVLDNLPVVIAIIDMEKRFTYLNARGESWFNRGSDGATGRPVNKVLDRGVWAQLEPLLDHALAGSVAHTEISFLHHSLGAERWLDIQCHPSISAGRIAGAYLLGVDVHSLKCAEREAAENAAQTEAVIEAAIDGIITINGLGTVERVNTAALEMLGYRRDEMLGRNLNMIMPEPHHSQHDGYLRHYRETGERRIIGVVRDLQVVRKDGKTLEIELSVSQVVREPEPFYLGIIRDVSERVAATRALRESEARLSRTVEELDRFTYIASHDLKAPLRAIDNLAKWVIEDTGPALDDLPREYLEKMQGRIARMERLLDDLLHYSRAGRKRGDLTTVDLNSFMAEVFDSCALPEEFTAAVAGSLPTVRTYTIPLRHVVQNLITNAFKHHDRPVGNVEVEGSMAGGLLELIVRDDGPGIPDALQGKAFELFQTLRPRDELESTGLGLAIVKKLVESEGGTILIDPHQGRGAVFRLRWPAEEVLENTL